MAKRNAARPAIEIKEILAQYKAGRSARELALQYGCSRQAIAYWKARADRAAELNGAKLKKQERIESPIRRKNGMLAPSAGNVKIGAQISDRALAALRELAIDLDFNQSQVINYLLLIEAADHNASAGRLAGLRERLEAAI